MADEKVQQQPQVYDSTLKEWMLQQPQAVISVLLPGAIYQETVNVEVIKPSIRADKVFKVFYEDEEHILHIEFESGSNTSMAARLLVYNAILYYDHNLPVISIIVYPFRAKVAESPLHVKTKRGQIITFHFQVLPLFMLEAEQFVLNHVACMYPLLPTMQGTDYPLIQQVLNELTELYKEDEVTLSQQLIWMGIFLDRTDTIAKPEKYKIQEKLSMYDQLWEENPKIQKIRAESKAEGKIEALQGALVTVVESRFPALSELAKEQSKHINKPDVLDVMVRIIATTSTEESTVRQMLNTLAA